MSKEWKKCACYTGPNGSGSRCSSNVSGSKFCKQHTTKCLKEIAQQQSLFKQQIPTTFKAFKQQPSVFKQPMVQPVFKQQPKPKKVAASRGCVKQTDKRYTDRASPPFPANELECRGKTMMGNNGKQWISKANSKGIYSWKEIKE